MGEEPEGAGPAARGHLPPLGLLPELARHDLLRLLPGVARRLPLQVRGVLQHVPPLRRPPTPPAVTGAAQEISDSTSPKRHRFTRPHATVSPAPTRRHGEAWGR